MPQYVAQAMKHNLIGGAGHHLNRCLPYATLGHQQRLPGMLIMVTETTAGTVGLTILGYTGQFTAVVLSGHASEYNDQRSFYTVQVAENSMSYSAKTIHAHSPLF